MPRTAIGGPPCTRRAYGSSRSSPPRRTARCQLSMRERPNLLRLGRLRSTAPHRKRLPPRNRTPSREQVPNVRPRSPSGQAALIPLCLVPAQQLDPLRRRDSRMPGDSRRSGDPRVSRQLVSNQRCANRPLVSEPFRRHRPRRDRPKRMPPNRLLLKARLLRLDKPPPPLENPLPNSRSLPNNPLPTLLRSRGMRRLPAQKLPTSHPTSSSTATCGTRLVG